MLEAGKHEIAGKRGKHFNQLPPASNNVQPQRSAKREACFSFQFLAETNYLSQTSIVQQHFGRKYSFQGIPNQVGKSWKFQGLGGGGYDKHPLG